MAGPSIYGFPKPDAEILAKMARHHGLETPVDAESPYAMLSQRLGKYMCYLAKTGSTAITARVGDTPGTGTVTLQRLDPFTKKIVDFKYLGEKQTMEVFSFVAEVSGTNAYVWIGRDVFGTLWYLNEACET